MVHLSAVEVWFVFLVIAFGVRRHCVVNQGDSSSE